MEWIFSNDTVQIILACIISTVFFVSSITYISKHPQKKTALIKWVFIIMFILGTVMYCIFNYLALEHVGGQEQSDWLNSGNNPLFRILYVVLRAVIDVGTMFYGRANTSIFYSLELSKNPLWVLLFWLVYVIAFYTAASALLIRFGGDLLVWIRITFAKVLGSEVHVIFGVNRNSLAFGKNIASTRNSTLIYVDSFAIDDYELSIRASGGIMYSDGEALRASPSFLARINPRKTKLRLHVMSADYDRNLDYARMMMETLEKANIPPEQTELMLIGADEMKGMIFQSGKNRYGYGNVVCFDEFEMTSRLLINKYPLCNAIKFDEDGRAVEDLEVLIGGCGRIGHEVLRKIIANGRFEGSNLSITIFDPRHGERTGFVRSQYPKMFAMPDAEIGFVPQDIRSGECFKFLREHAAKLKYIVICLDDREHARDIAVRIVDRLQTMGHPLNVYTCDTRSVRCYSTDARECKTHWVYDSDLLYSGELDKYAIEINHVYGELYRESTGQKTGVVPAADDWKTCDYFGRMSSRASVDYLIPLIRKVTHDSGVLTPSQRENLSKSEHLRWCAFHYTFGFEPMEREEFLQRINKRLEEIKEHGSSSVKMTKDMEKRTHVCLVSWDELDEISDMENSLTHDNADYKENDRRNVDLIAGIARKMLPENPSA